MSRSDASVKPAAKPRKSAAKSPPPAPIPLDPALVEALVAGRFADPFAILGPHPGPQGRVIRTLQPGALAVRVLDRASGAVIGELAPEGGGGFFSGAAPSRSDSFQCAPWLNRCRSRSPRIRPKL